MAASHKRKPTPRSNTSGLHRAQRTISADAGEPQARPRVPKSELSGNTTELDATAIAEGARARGAISARHGHRIETIRHARRSTSADEGSQNPAGDVPAPGDGTPSTPTRPITRPNQRPEESPYVLAPRAASAKKRTPRRRNKAPKGVIIAACCVVAVAVGLVVAFAAGAFNTPVTSPSEGMDGLYVPPVEDDPADGEGGVAPTMGEASVSLSAVGDNLMHIPVVNTADYAEGSYGDGLYDFTVLYAGVKDIIDTHDINFIDIETPMGGDERGISGYPSFNTPSDDAADIADFGFNLASTATNHAWDGGLEGIQNMNATWAEHPEVVVTGTFVNQEDRDRIRVFEKNGITFAFLAYQDYLNGYVLPDDLSWAIADSNDRAKVKADIDKAHELAECVIVAMSWGDEYANQPNQSQRDCAQFFADNGVDLVLGFGPHVIQPVEWLDAAHTTGDGAENPFAGHRTLAVFSLGNFVSNQQDAFSNVEGCFTCNITRDANDAIAIADPTWIPLVNHFSGGAGHTVYQLKNYTEELARQHDVLGSLEDPLGYVRSYTTDYINPEVVNIDM